MKQKYTKEFRDEAVRRVIDGGKSRMQVAKELEINHWTLRDWIKAKKQEIGKQPVKTETLEEENRRLQNELKNAAEEIEILKKAAAYFAREQK